MRFFSEMSYLNKFRILCWGGNLKLNKFKDWGQGKFVFREMPPTGHLLAEAPHATHMESDKGKGSKSLSPDYLSERKCQATICILLP